MLPEQRRSARTFNLMPEIIHFETWNSNSNSNPHSNSHFEARSSQLADPIRFAASHGNRLNCRQTNGATRSSKVYGFCWFCARIDLFTLALDIRSQLQVIAESDEGIAWSAN